MPDETVNQQANAGADNTAEQMDQDIDLETLDQESDVEVLREKLRTTAQQKKHWREKAKKFEGEIQKAQEVKPEPKKEKSSGFDPDALREEITQEITVRQKYPNLSDDEMARAKKLATMDSKKLSEVVADPYFQAYLKANADSRAAERARPNPSNRTGNPMGYVVGDLSDPAKIAQMDDETFKQLSDSAAKTAKFGVVHRQ